MAERAKARSAPAARIGREEGTQRNPAIMIVAAVALLPLLLLRGTQSQVRPVLLWNASPSSPVGLYGVTSPVRPAVGETIVAWPPRWARRLAAARGYLPATVPLVKSVAAAAGDRLCAEGSAILVNGRPVSVRRRRDPSGRPMPWWTGCRALGSGDLFLLSTYTLAFDGRYFGVTRPGEVIGRARPLWTR
jgi:conjugative transfer signal peptidase TraF